MFCPHCGVQNADDAEVCGSCKTQLPKLFASGSPVATAAEPGDKASAALSVLYRRSASGGNWFYWIAGMSLLNTLIVLFHGKMSFVLGLGVTQVIDAGIRQLGGRSALVLMPINLIFAGIYVMFGYFACRRAMWAFIAGIVCYSLDTLLFLLARDVFGLGFHVFALFCIIGGLKALNIARKIEAQQAQTLVRY
jgi:hypothetical protein